ncbi:MAG TPA: hypothetical protein VGF24_30610 [Vicinamibacterales bacterium]
MATDQIDVNHVQAEEQRFAERSDCMFSSEVAARSRDEADACGLGLRARLRLQALAKKSEELHLSLCRQLDDVVDEKRASVGFFEHAPEGDVIIGVTPGTRHERTFRLDSVEVQEMGCVRTSAIVLGRDQDRHVKACCQLEFVVLQQSQEVRTIHLSRAWIHLGDLPFSLALSRYV